MLFLNEKLTLRTNENYYKDAVNGTIDEPSNGVKGLTFLGDHIKFPDNVLIDYMHLIFERVCKILFQKWFNIKNKGCEFYKGTDSSYFISIKIIFKILIL